MLCKLRVAHVQNLEQISSVKSAFSIIAIHLSMLCCHLVSCETRSEYDSSSISINRRHLPRPNQAQSAFADLFDRCKRNSRIFQCDKTCCTCQLSCNIPCSCNLCFDSKFFFRVKSRHYSCKLRDISEFLGCIHSYAAISSFD